MPQFVLDYGSAQGAHNFKDLSSFAQGYVEALFFTDEKDLGEATFSELHPDTLARIKRDCARFQQSGEWKAFEDWCDEAEYPASDEQAGRDFWFTRNGHGVGFWDRAPELYGPHQDALDRLARDFSNVDAYLGDDGLIYLA